MMVCHGNLLACDPNPTHDVGLCVRCVGRHRTGIARLSGRVQVEPFVQLTDKDRRELRDLKTDWQTVQEMNEFAVDNFDAGWAAQSSLASQFMRPDYSVDDQHDQIRRTDPLVGGRVSFGPELLEPRPRRSPVRVQRPLRHLARRRCAPRRARASRFSFTSAGAASRSSRCSRIIPRMISNSSRTRFDGPGIGPIRSCGS